MRYVCVHNFYDLDRCVDGDFFVHEVYDYMAREKGKGSRQSIASIARYLANKWENRGSFLDALKWETNNGLRLGVSV